jgi:hypothetical protein
MNKPPASSTAEPATTPEADLLSRLKASLGEAESYEVVPVFAANLRAAIVALESATTPASTAVELPPLPEWSKRDDFGGISGMLPSEVRTGLRDYARAHEANVRRALATIPASMAGPFELTRSIIYDCPALKLPQSFAGRLGMVAQIVVLKGASPEVAAFIVESCNARTAFATTPQETK